MMENKTGAQLFEELIGKIPSYIRRLTKKQIRIANAIRYQLNSQSLYQVDLAKKIGVSEARISKILAGGENLTLKTISKLEDALNEDLVFINDPTATYQYTKQKKWDNSKTSTSSFIPLQVTVTVYSAPEEHYDRFCTMEIPRNNSMRLNKLNRVPQ